MFQQQQQQQHRSSRGPSPSPRGSPRRPPPINTAQVQPAGPTPIMRQGRFLSPTNASSTGGASPYNHGHGRGSGGYHPQYHHQPQQQQPHHHYNNSIRNNPQAMASPTSQVRFDEETLSPMENRERHRQHHSPAFMFEDGEWGESDDDIALGGNLDDRGSGEEDPDDNGPPPPILPSETQLTLLCLDYLRDLRRSYPRHSEDMRNAEGLDPDYIALAAWSLSRAFIRPGKLRHVDAGISLIKGSETTPRGKRHIEIPMMGGGGLGGLEDEAYGNDAWYRQMEDDVDVDLEMERVSTKKKNVFALSENISLPSMEDITDEILLRHPSEKDFFNKDSKDEEDEDEDDDDEDDDEPLYEHNDNHLSNSHRFYLLNGLASDSAAAAVDGLISPRSIGFSPRNAPNGTPQHATSSFHGSPLTISEIASAGLAALRARPRVDADRELVRNPLFRQFVDAASAGGFFQEKRSDERRKSFMSGKKSLTAVEEELRSRLLYEEKYRKVVDKFRTKLASKEAQLISHQSSGHHPSQSPYNKFAGSPSRSLSNAYRIMSGNASVSSGVSGGGGGVDGAMNVDAIMSVGEVAERQRRRRERRAERVKSQRTSEREVSSVVAKSPPGIPAMLGNAASQEDDSSEMDENDAMLRKQQSPSRLVKSSKVQTQTSLPLSANDGDEEDDEALYQEAEKLNTVGNSLMQKKSFQKALATYTSAISISPTGPNSHVYHSNRSAAYLSLNEYESSVEDSLRSIELKPTYAKAHSRLGLAYFAMGRYGEAVDAYERSLEIDPQNEWSKDHLRKALAVAGSQSFEEGDVGDGAVSAEKDVGAKVKNGDTTEEVTDEQDDDGDWPTPFDEDGRGPDDVNKEGDLNPAPVGEQKGGGDESEHDEPQNITTTSPPAVTVADAVDEQETLRKADRHKDKGNQHMSNKDYEKALRQYNLAITASPSGPNSHVYYSNRAAAYCYMARYEDASSDCRKSVELNPAYEKAHARLGLSLFLRGMYGDAIKAYEKSLELDPNNKASLSYLRKAKAKFAEVRWDQQHQHKEEASEKKKTMDEVDSRRESIKDEESTANATQGQSIAPAPAQYNQQQNIQQDDTVENEEEGALEEEEEGSIGDETGITSTGLTSIVTNDDMEEEDIPRDDNNEGAPSAKEERPSFPSSPASQEAFDPFDTTDDN